MRLKINEAIEKSGYMKKYIAKELDINPVTMSNYISGKRKITLELAVKLAEILKCDITDLYERK
jgi:DNA-binding XRE family transcriptional regulator